MTAGRERVWRRCRRCPDQAGAFGLPDRSAPRPRLGLDDEPEARLGDGPSAGAVTDVQGCGRSCNSDTVNNIAIV